MRASVKRGGRANEDHFDLLPFITILMAVLGTLLLVTMSLAAISVGPGLGEGWVPTADDDNPSTKTAVLLEWDGTHVIAHWPDGKQTAKFVRRYRIRGKIYRRGEERPDGSAPLVEMDDEALGAWDEILSRLEHKKEDQYALFAVRPSGFGNFHTMTREIRSRGIDIGYEPIEQNRPVRLIRNKLRSQK